LILASSLKDTRMPLQRLSAEALKAVKQVASASQTSKSQRGYILRVIISEAESLIEALDRISESFQIPAAVASTPIETLGLRIVYVNALKAQGILTIGDFKDVGPRAISLFRGLGRKAVDDITAALELYGVRIPGESAQIPD